MQLITTTRGFHGTFTMPAGSDTVPYAPFTKGAVTATDGTAGTLLIAGSIPTNSGTNFLIKADSGSVRTWFGSQKGGGNAGTVYYGDVNRQNRPILKTTDDPGVYDFNCLLPSLRFLGTPGDKVEFAIYW